MGGSPVSALPADAQQRIHAARTQTPIAQMTITLYGLGRGESAVGWNVAPTGPLSAANDTKSTAVARATAYKLLLAAVQAEIDRNFGPLTTGG